MIRSVWCVRGSNSPDARRSGRGACWWLRGFVAPLGAPYDSFAQAQTSCAFLPLEYRKVFVAGIRTPCTFFPSEYRMISSFKLGLLMRYHPWSAETFFFNSVRRGGLYRLMGPLSSWYFRALFYLVLIFLEYRADERIFWFFPTTRYFSTTISLSPHRSVFQLFSQIGTVICLL